ncbi:MAG: DUF2067 family protein [Candidatus Heimdallarchaeota archaeon]|nr:DUF2067 family protein [Candidatus Heimdallarchaeota archaeon]
MTKYKRNKSQSFSKKIYFNIDSTDTREYFLKYALQLLDKEDFRLDTKLGRLEFQIYGNKSNVEDVIQKLNKLDEQIHMSTIVDNQGFYHHHSSFLMHYLKPEIKLSFYMQALAILNYQVREDSTDNTMITSISLRELVQIHTKLVSLLRSSPKSEHRDIQRFMVLIRLKTNQEFTDIIERASKYQLLADRGSGLQFTSEPEFAIIQYLEMEKDQEESELKQIDLDEDQDELMVFDGGKIVFMQNGVELDRSPFDILGEDKDKE